MSEVAKMKKPQLRGLLQSSIKTNLIVSIGLCIAAGVAMKVFVNDVRKQKYADFYKNFDIEKDFEEKKAKGVFQSCQ